MQKNYIILNNYPGVLSLVARFKPNRIRYTGTKAEQDHGVAFAQAGKQRRSRSGGVCTSNGVSTTTHLIRTRSQAGSKGSTAGSKGHRWSSKRKEKHHKKHLQYLREAQACVRIAAMKIRWANCGGNHNELDCTKIDNGAKAVLATTISQEGTGANRFESMTDKDKEDYGNIPSYVGFMSGRIAI